MRIVKEAAERKNEILDAAEELFAARGYEETSTGDILDRVGIARGTLYYHFRSKEEILDALIERLNRTMIARAEKAAVPLYRCAENAIDPADQHYSRGIFQRGGKAKSEEIAQYRARRRDEAKQPIRGRRRERHSEGRKAGKRPCHSEGKSYKKP